MHPLAKIAKIHKGALLPLLDNIRNHTAAQIFDRQKAKANPLVRHGKAHTAFGNIRRKHRDVETAAFFNIAGHLRGRFQYTG